MYFMRYKTSNFNIANHVLNMALGHQEVAQRVRRQRVEVAAWAPLLCINQSSFSIFWYTYMCVCVCVCVYIFVVIVCFWLPR